MFKKLWAKISCIFMAVMMFMPISVYAAPASTASEMSQFPNITVSPDGSGMAWTTDLWDKTDERLPIGYTIDMDAESTIRDLKEGEHYYAKAAVGSVTIGKWVVAHSPGQCIHDTPTKDSFAGFTYANEICRRYYNNGWFAYCADCGELVAYMHIYGKSTTMEKITSMPASSVYVYLCPYCTHLEQGASYQHICTGVSNNKYRVTYRPNAPTDSSVEGYMAPTMHMYGNADTYNGESAASLGYTDTELRKNSYSCEGYVFVGWNTEPDGSGQSFNDGQEVLNLSSKDNGIVKLYAQWQKSESTLALDAAGGTYHGKTVYEQKQKFGTTYTVDNGKLVPPKGYTVSFETNGGSAVATITTTKSFSHWEEQAGFAGEFRDNVYAFLGTNGSRDVLEAQYVNNSFTLPDSQKDNASLAGWYEDPDLEEDSFVGKPGDEVIVDKDTVLYAKWATLTLWAYDDYTSHGGVGAVDLEWEQKDGRSKYYRLFQSMDQTTWKEIYTGNNIGNSITVSENYGTDKQGTTYTVPYNGFYTLTAYGAKGADYSTSLTGGKGGSVTATYWLRKEDVLTFYAGSAGNGVSGGSNGTGIRGGTSNTSNGCGGGAATEIYLTRDGAKNVLLVAGGGGGANVNYAGGAGGKSLTAIGDQAGESSDYGGGGSGAVGGSSKGSTEVTTIANTKDYAFKSNLSKNLSAGTVQVYGMAKEEETPTLNKVIGTGQDSWKKITSMGSLSSTFASSYSLWYDGDDCWFGGYSTGTAAVGQVPYIEAQARDGITMYLSNTYETNGNTRLLIGCGLHREDYGAPGHTTLQLTVTNAETGSVLYSNTLYHGYSDNSKAGIAAVEDIDISSANKVTIRITSGTEGTQENTQGHKTQLYFSDIIFYGKTVASAGQATGGSSYINTGFGCKDQTFVAGVNAGGGYAQIVGSDIGYKEETQLDDVLAKDMAAPGKITLYNRALSGMNLYRVSLTDPEDYGTNYYHKAESFAEDSNTRLAVSNITKNALTTGVKGYRYYVDTNATGTVAASHNWTESRSVEVKAGSSVQYLHVAAVDVAGNIGPTTDILIPKADNMGDEELTEDYFEAVPPMTDMLSVEDTEYVYQVSANTYYVKADGATEHTLFGAGFMDGKATNKYQVDMLRLVSNVSGSSEWFQIRVPKVNIQAGEKSFSNAELQMNASQEKLQYLIPDSALAERTHQAVRVSLEQRFHVDSDMDGQTIEVYPRAIAEYEDKEHISEEAKDKTHKAILIPDAQAPMVSGIEDLQSAGNIDMTEESRDFVISAADDGSGVRKLTVTITNLDNTLSRTYTSDTETLTITMEKEDYLFLGDFVVSAVAVDNVGNSINLGADSLAFTLDAELQRAREPHDGDFKAGDGAVLTVTTGGYADKVIIRFQEELLALNPNLNKEYVYEYPEAIKIEVYEFNLPIGTPSSTYYIEVEAWKDGRKLSTELELPVRTDGSVWEEFRTRIRDNGV